MDCTFFACLLGIVVTEGNNGTVVESQSFMVVQGEVTTSVVCLCAFGGEHSSAECAASLARRHMELVKVASTLLA